MPPTIFLIESSLIAVANTERAVAMSSYMRDQFPFLGIPTPQRRLAVKEIIATKMSAQNAIDLACQLWLKPEREYRYVAIDLLTKQHKQLTPDHIPTLLTLARTGAWWDTVDSLSSVINKIIRHNPFAQSMMDDALVHDNFWTRRTAMIHQLGWRNQTDTSRLFHYALHLSGEKEFFIRKAIGWAFRDYARWQPSMVKSFVLEHQAKLSSLTVREALKHIA